MILSSDMSLEIGAIAHAKATAIKHASERSRLLGFI